MRNLRPIFIFLTFFYSHIGLAKSPCDMNELVRISFESIRRIEVVLPDDFKVSSLEGGLMPFNVPPANTDFNIFVSYKQTNLKKNKTNKMVGVYYFDSSCEMVGSMTRSVFPEGDPRIIELQ